MLLTTTAKIKHYSQFYSWVFAFTSRGIVGFTEQWTAFTRTQSAILQSGDFIWCVERALKITYPRSLYLKKTKPVTPYFFIKIFLLHTEEETGKIRKNSAEWNFADIDISIFLI